MITRDALKNNVDKKKVELSDKQTDLNNYILALKLLGKNQDLAKLQIDVTKQIDTNLAKKYLLNKQIEQTHTKYLIAEADKESLDFQYFSFFQQLQRMTVAKSSAEASIKSLNEKKNALTGLFNGDIKTINDSITKLNQQLITLQNKIKDPNTAASTKLALKADANAALITLDVEQGKLQIKTLDRDQRIGLLNLQITQHTERIKLFVPQITSQELIVAKSKEKFHNKTLEYNNLGTKEKGFLAELAAHEKKYNNLLIEHPEVAVDKLITIAELKQQQDLLIDRELDTNKERYFALEQLQAFTISYVEVIVKNANTTTLATYNSFLENLTDKTKDLADIWQGNLAESVDYTQTIALEQSKLSQEREKLNKYVEEKLADPDGKYYLAGIELEEAALLRDYFAYRYDGLTHAETVTKSIVELYKKQNQQVTDLTNKIKPYLEFSKYTQTLVDIDKFEQQIINIKNSLVDPKTTDFKKIESFLIANGKIGGIQAKYDALIKPYNDILAAETKLLSSPAYLNAPLTDSFNITSPFPNTGYAVGFNNYNYLSGDFNGDGKTDLIHLATKSYTHTWISKGDGKFDIKSPFPTTGYGVELNNYKYLTGDFNGDGKTDLIHFATNSYTHTWLSKGDGTFDIKSPFPTVPYGVSANNYKYLTGDFNGDGKTDLIHLVNEKYTHTWLSKGDGTFDIKSPFPTVAYGVSANNYKYLTGDFNGDGKTDLIHFVNNKYAHTWLSKGDGTFDIKSPFPNTGYGVDSNNYNYQTGDFNGDGKTDLIHFANNSYVHIWIAKGDGTFDIKNPFIPGNGYAVGSNNYNYRLGDFNGDKKTDLIHFVDSKNINKWTSKGDGTFEITTPIANTGYGVSSNNYNYQTGDFNGDGKTDLVHFVNNNYVHILNSLGDSQTAQKNKIDAQIAVVKQKVTQDLQGLINPVIDTLNPIINDKQQQALSTLGNFLSKDIKDFATASTQPLLKQYITDRLTIVNQIDSQIATATLPQREELQRQKTTGLINLKLEITQLLQSPATASLFLIKYNQLSATDKPLKLKQLREESFPGSTENVDLNQLQQQIFTQQTNYQTEQEKLTKEIQTKQASANADLAQAQWYEEQAAIHWTASHKQGSFWIEKRQYKQRTLFGKKTKTSEVRHVDTNWIIWDAYTTQAKIEREQAKKTLDGDKPLIQAKGVVDLLLDNWTEAAKDAQNAGSTKTEFQTYITKLETEKSTWINKNNAATLEKILPIISKEVVNAEAALDKANKILKTEQDEYELSKKNYQAALDGVLDKKSLVDLQTQQVKLQLAAAEEWIKQELNGLDEEIQLTQKNKADLTTQIGTITEQLKTAPLQKAELTSKKLLLEQSVQLITYQEAVLTKEKNNFTQKQSLITAQRNVINSEEKLLDKYLESPDNDYSNLEKELASARAALIDVQKLNQDALESSEKIADSLEKIQADLFLQYDTKLAAVKDQQKVFQELLTATKLQANYTAKEAEQQGVLNEVKTTIIARLIEADRAGSAEAQALLKQASANNWKTVADTYASDYEDLLNDTGSKCSQGIAKPGDAALAKKYKDEAAKYSGLENDAKTQAANLKSLREQNQTQINALKEQELLAQRDLDVWSNKVAVTQQEIDKKQQELILAEVRIDVLGSMIEWTTQATNQLLTIEKLNYEQALLVQDLVAKRQLGIDKTVLDRLEREQGQLDTHRQGILSQIQQVTQVQTETALQSAINELRADLGLGGISLVPNQNKSLAELQQQISELQKDPKLPANIQTLLNQTKLDIGEVLKGKELAKIQDNLLKASDALIKQNDLYQSQLAAFEQDEQNYRDIYTRVQSDLQGATAKFLNEFQKTGRLESEKSLLEPKILENLYKLANGASAVAIATAIGKQPRALIEQIIEARIEDRIVRKKAFLNEVFGVFGTALKLVGTVLSFTPFAPFGVALTAAGGAIGAVQAAYNGNWASAVYQLAATILTAATSITSAKLASAQKGLDTATRLNNVADKAHYKNIVDGFKQDLGKLKVLEISTSTIHNTYQAAKDGNATGAFLIAIDGVAKGVTTWAAASPSVSANFQSFSKILNVANNLSRATAGAIGAFENGQIFEGLKYIGQAAGNISKDLAKDLEKDNLKALSVVLKVTQKAPTAYQAIQAFKNGDWINAFGKTFETIKPLGEFFKSPGNATNGQAVPGNPTDIVSKAKSWIDTIETRLQSINKIIKDKTGLDYQGWINVAKTNLEVIALLKQDNVKGLIKGINDILDIWQKEGDSATLATFGKVLDTAEKLVNSYETGTLNGWLSGLDDTLGIWEPEIRGFVENRRQKAIADLNFDTTKSLDDIKDPILKATIENNRKFLSDTNKIKALNLTPTDPNLKDYFSFNIKTNQMYFLADTILHNATNGFGTDKKVKLYVPITDLNNPPNIAKIKAQIANGSPEIKLIIHGFRSNIDSRWQEDLAEIETKNNPNAIVIIADWGDMAGKNRLDYLSAAKNTNFVGDAIAAKLIDLGIKDPSKITIIGHSLGAQVAANISESFQVAKLGKVAKIIALDPARPGFENSFLWWGNNSKNLENRLDGSDATSIEIIHTSYDTAFPFGLGYKNPVLGADNYYVPKEVRNIYSGSDHSDAIDIQIDYFKNKLPNQTFDAFIKQKQAEIAAQPKPTTPIVLSSLKVDLSDLKGVKSFADLTLKQTKHNGEDYTWVYFKGQDPTQYFTIPGVSPRQLSAANFNFIPKTIAGTSGNDTLIGDAANNTFNGGAGADTMTGGAGDDTYIVDNVSDIVTEKLNEGIDTVQSSVTHTLVLNVEKLNLTGTDAINGTGNILNNIMIGNSAANTLYGAGGSDSLTGGLGADKFLFKSKSEGIDTISDFTTGSDKIVISAAGFGAGLVAGTPINANQWLKVTLGSAATSASQRFVYNSTTGGLYFDADGSGIVGAVQFATLSNKANLTVTDFVVI